MVQFGSYGGASRFSGNLLESLLHTRNMRRGSSFGRFSFEGYEIVALGQWCSVLQNFVFWVFGPTLAGSAELVICEGVVDPNSGPLSQLLVKLLNLLGFRCGRIHAPGSGGGGGMAEHGPCSDGARSSYSLNHFKTDLLSTCSREIIEVHNLHCSMWVLMTGKAANFLH